MEFCTPGKKAVRNSNKPATICSGPTHERILIGIVCQVSGSGAVDASVRVNNYFSGAFAVSYFYAKNVGRILN
jgi:hypothetical protein